MVAHAEFLIEKRCRACEKFGERLCRRALTVLFEILITGRELREAMFRSVTMNPRNTISASIPETRFGMKTLT
jgi:hypothetical protein